MGSVDLYQLEKVLASKTTRQIRTAFRSAIQQTTESKTGEALRTAGARAVFVDDRLQRIAIKAPHYIFKQQYGFEGRKKNGVNMRLTATDVLTKTLEGNNILENLSTEISEIRLSQIIAKINF